MKLYKIDAAGNALILVKVDADKIEILNGIDGWTQNIKDHITIEEMKKD